jgi:hypothetical protein
MIIADPDACRHCDIPQRMHCQRYTDSVGWHGWAAPTDQQRLTRMRARRAGHTMNIYLIKRVDQQNYDEFCGAVVIAASPEAAMALNPKSATRGAHWHPHQMPNEWRPERLKIIRIGSATPRSRPRVVLADYWPG